MAIDIMLAIPNVAINDKRAVCSTTPTGFSAKLLIRDNYPLDLTIENIESKFDDKFDDRTYYTLGYST
jgi:hypothetical protein